MLMIVPALIGYLIDQKVGSRFVFTLLGLLLGMTGAVLQLIRLVSVTNKPSSDSLDGDASDDDSTQT
jgi:F0F1-type ATP synthase assembly protein I